MKLQGKVVVITGGGSGIGGVASRIFAGYGAKVVILELNPVCGKQTEEEIIAAGGEAWFIQTDVSNLDAVQAAFDQIKEKYGRVDALYNNASVFWGGRDTVLENLEADIWKKVLAINLDSVFYCSKCAIPLMKEHGGAIINTASSAAVVGVPGCAAYTATKGATVGLTRAMGVELGKYNIRVNCVIPGTFPNPAVKEDPAFIEKLANKTMMGRVGINHEIAGAIVLLASDASTFMTGSSITVDGGWTAW